MDMKRPIEALKDWTADKTRPVAMVVALGLGIVGCSDSNEKPQADAADVAVETTTTTTVNSEAQLKALLTVTDQSGFDCVRDNDGTAKVSEYNGVRIIIPRLVDTLPIDSEERSQDNRLFSDAIANPIVNVETKEKALKEFQNTLCESPEVTAMAAHYFANKTIEGVKVVDLNPWLQKYEGNTNTINDRALEFVPQYTNTNATGDQALEANKNHRAVAEKLATLMNRFENMGFSGDIRTTLNYHLVAGGAQAGSLSEIELNKEQYTGNFLVLKLTAKDGRCFTVMLVNIDDQRIAEAENGNCKVVPTTTKAVATTTTSAVRATTTTRPHASTTTSTTTTQPSATTSTSTTSTTTTRPNTSTTSTTTSTTTPKNQAPVPTGGNAPIGGTGAGGNPDKDNNPGNNATTSTSIPRTTTTGSNPVTTTTRATSVTSTTLGPVYIP